MRKISLIIVFLFFIKSLSAQTINYTYDNLGRLTQTVYPDSSIIKYSYDANGNRITKRTKGPQTINFKPLTAIIYGAQDIAPGATANSGLAVNYTSANAAVATIVNGKLHIIGAGTSTITASQPGNGSYNAAKSVNDTITIKPAPLTIKAKDTTKTYGKTNSLKVSYTGFVNGDDSTKLTTKPVVVSIATISSAVGTYPITASGAASANYTFTYSPGTLTVTPAPLTITADSKSKKYSDANPSLTVSYTGFVNGDDTTKLTNKPNISTTAVTNSVAGSYPITVSSATAANYTINFVAGTLTVIPAPVPTITAISPNTGIAGTTITITGTYFLGVTAVSFGGTPASSFTVNSPTSITAIVGTGASGNVTVTTPTGTGTIAGFAYIFNLPPANFKLTITSVTCKGSNNGSVNITAAQALSYTATITGNGLNAPYPFTTTQDINNLAAGTYSVCITVAGQSAYKQCFDVVITEPKDLSLYATINGSVNTVDLALSGGDQYNINLNGVLYTTTNSNITLPLKEGNNNLLVTTDKLCQGAIQKTINVYGKIVPYPDPFQETLSLNLGKDNIKKVSIEIHAVSDAKVVYSKQYTNQSGVLQLDLSSLNSGVYALKLMLDNAEQIIKILKK
jgi:YD repeat-containing protein